MTNTWPQLPFPTEEGQIGGHEGIGHIVKLGPGTENSGVKVGDRVGIKWLAGICGNCGMSTQRRQGTHTAYIFHICLGADYLLLVCFGQRRA